MKKKKTLYIGAHQDDVFLGAGMQINKRLEDTYILTLSDGTSAVKYPWVVAKKIFNTPEEYYAQRIMEDKSAMEMLGVDVDNNYFNAKIPDGRFYEHISEIVESIEKIVKEKGIEKIISHSVPEVHPDHEITWFSSNVVAKKLEIDIWEFVTYRFDENEKFVRTFLDNNQMSEIEENIYTFNEKKFREKVASLYVTQKHLLDQYGNSGEIFGKRKIFNLENIPETPYYYKNREGYLSCKKIRSFMGNFEK
jgi:LmbE family N-acetylglucosaminyl deacetylase